MKKLSWTRVGEAYSMVTRVIVEGQALQSHIPPEMSSVDSSRLDGFQHVVRNDSSVNEVLSDASGTGKGFAI